MPNPFFFTNNQFQFQNIQVSMSYKFTCQKNFYFKHIQLRQMILIQTIQVSLSKGFLYSQWNEILYYNSV